MATQLLIYETAVPVSAARHRDASVEVGADYAFARNVNSVPLMAVEFPHTAPEDAIVFSRVNDEVIPAAVLRVRGNQKTPLRHRQLCAQYHPSCVPRHS